MAVLVDTNILLRAAQPTHEMCAVAQGAVAVLLRRAEAVHFCPQNIAEFWCVATRPVAMNGLGFTVEEARSEVEQIERILFLLPDTPAIYPEWRRLVAEHAVRGLKVFDARLAAVAIAHGVDRILTFNGGDFRAYERVLVVDPRVLAA